MSGFARGKYAYGISDRSGVRYKLNRMKRVERVFGRAGRV